MLLLCESDRRQACPLPAPPNAKEQDVLLVARGKRCLQPVLNSEFSFKPGDFVAKPPPEDLFGLGGIQSGDSSALLIERNMVTRDIFAFVRLGEVLHENAFSARMST